jgi:hypothetical protein
MIRGHHGHDGQNHLEMFRGKEKKRKGSPLLQRNSVSVPIPKDTSNLEMHED